MAGPHRPGPKSGKPAGKERPWRPSPIYLALATAILGIVFASLLFWSRAPIAVGAADEQRAPAGAADTAAAAPVAASDSVAVAASRPAGTAPRAPQIARMRDPNGDLTPDISDYVNKGEKPTMPEVIDRLHQAGVQSGLGAFSPPGTRPPLIGLAVPDDFVLPEGYVRHHQATDDGQRIEPILMFSPDHQFFDAEHRPIAIPKDRVVPPELAPPGLPIRRIVIPAPTEPGR